MNKSIDFNVALNISSDLEEEQQFDENEDGEVDLYGDLSVALMALQDEDECYFEELSDLSDDELLEELAVNALEPASNEEETQELSYSEDDLLGEPQSSSTRASSPTATPVTPPASPTAESAPVMDMDMSIDEEAESTEHDSPVQGCDNAVLYRTKEEIEKIIAMLPHRPLPATIARWTLREPSPSMKEYIERIRVQIAAEGPSKFFLPWNLRDTINVKKERQLAQGPFVNRQMIIEEYRLKKVRESWSKNDEKK